MRLILASSPNLHTDIASAECVTSTSAGNGPGSTQRRRNRRAGLKISTAVGTGPSCPKQMKRAPAHA
jgi:hypothetical protein